MGGSLRLSYSLTRPFSIRATVVGVLAITLTLLTAASVTLFTKGRIHSSEQQYLSAYNSPGFHCNASLVYPGQSFGGVPWNSTFTYVAQNSFAYNEEHLYNCSLRPDYSFEVIGPPMAWPRLSYNYTVDCLIRPSVTATFGIASLNHAPRDVQPVTAYGLWNQTVGAMSDVWNNPCYDQPVQAFRVEPMSNMLYLFDPLSIAFCILPLSNDNFTAVQLLSRDIGILALQDFAEPTVHLNPLPNLLYACTPTKPIWASPWTIFLECYTSAAATFSPATAIITWIIVRASGIDRSRVEDWASKLRRSDHTEDEQKLLALEPQDAVTLSELSNKADDF